MSHWKYSAKDRNCKHICDSFEHIKLFWFQWQDFVLIVSVPNNSRMAIALMLNRWLDKKKKQLPEEEDIKNRRMPCHNLRIPTWCK